jgi:Ca2+-binding EF-hand superfamily protein
MLRYSKESDFTKLVMVVSSKFLYNESTKEANSVFEMFNQKSVGAISSRDVQSVFRKKLITMEGVAGLVSDISIFRGESITYSELLACFIYPHEKHIVTKEILWISFKYLS